MNFIKSNKGLVIGILVGLFVVGAIVFVSTQTGLFDEDERLFKQADNNVNEEGEVIVEEGKDDSEEDSATGIKEVPEEIKSFVELPEARAIVDGENEDGTFNSEEAKITQMWEHNGLTPVDGDESIVRDAKEDLRITSYEDYKNLQEKGMNDITTTNILELGTLGFSDKSDYVYKNNTVVDFGDVKLVGGNIDGDMFNVTLEFQNESGELIDMNELQNNVQFRFVEDFGLGTDWKTAGEMSETYTGIEGYNEGNSVLNQYLGRGLTKNVSVLAIDLANGVMLSDALDSENLITEELMFSRLGIVGTEESMGDNFDAINEYQRVLPSELKLEVKYGEETTDYELLKSNEGASYNYEEALK